MSRRRRLRELVSERQGIVVPGAYDCLSAKLVERAGFSAVYVTGFGTAASRFGLPDLGLLGLSEMAEQARAVAAAVELPVIADADTGYGNALNVRRTVRLYESAGVAALQIEDQTMPKRCGHLSGHELVSRGEFSGRIRAAVDSRSDPDLLVIARTDAISAAGLDEALRRGETALEAGADVLFVEAPTDRAQIGRIASAFDAPLLYNLAAGGRSPALSFAELRELRFAIVLLPIDALLAAAGAVRDRLAAIAAAARATEEHGLMSFAELNALLGAEELLALGERYRTEEGDSRPRK